MPNMQKQDKWKECVVMGIFQNATSAKGYYKDRTTSVSERRVMPEG